MPSHVQIVDKFEVRHRKFDRPLIFACRNDGVIELYSNDEGQEMFAGILGPELKVTGEARDLLVNDIAQHIRKNPVSVQSLAWLQGLYNARLL